MQVEFLNARKVVRYDSLKNGDGFQFPDELDQDEVWLALFTKKHETHFGWNVVSLNHGHFRFVAPEQRVCPVTATVVVDLVRE
jgi:hypothetical protein